MTTVTLIQRHSISDLNECQDIVSSSWIQSEIEKAEESLKRVHSSLAHQQQDEQEEEQDVLTRTSNNRFESPDKESSALLLYNEALNHLSARLDYIHVSNSYLCAMKKVNGSVGIQDLLTLELELKRILDHADLSPPEKNSSTSSTFHQLILKIITVKNKVVQHIRARSMLFIRKLLTKHAFPCPSASEFLVEERMTPTTGLYIHSHALEQMDGKMYVARELLRPITHRVIHHFVQSRTIPQNKLDKLPHLLLEYIRKVLLYTVPVFEAFHVENEALGLVYGLIQHILFRRGYYERMGALNTLELCRFIQDTLRFSKDVQEMMGDTILNSSLFEVLVCQNTQLWHWWLAMEYNQVNTIFKQVSQDDTVKSLEERFHSLIFSLDIKASFLNQSIIQSEYANNVMVPSCTIYIDLLAKRAKRLKEDVDSITSLDVLPYMMKWMKLMDVADDVHRNLNACRSSVLKSFSPSFQKMCDGMLEECTGVYIDILFERTTFSSFLMNARHLLSGDVDDLVSIEDVLALLSVWSKLEGNHKNEIHRKVAQVVSIQILSIILDKSQYLAHQGCDRFNRIVLDIIHELDVGGKDDQEDLRRLQDILSFMQESSWSQVKIMLHNAFGMHQHESFNIRDLDHDPAMQNEIEILIRSHYSTMTIDDALSIMQRLMGDV